jgi:5-methylcytosine-specific restriction endonuclease McrA
MTLKSDFGERTINELGLMFRNRQINLEPGFQRQSVWTPLDRRRLVQSIVSQYPIPSIFLYQRNHRGRLVYDVIDGKQRLETIFMFTQQGRFRRHWFDVKLPWEDSYDWFAWKDVKRYLPDARHHIDSYKIQTVEVQGELPEIIDLFVRINSTGKSLTSGEKRHARFYTSRFLKEAERLIDRNEGYFLRNRILSRTQLDRMKGTELVSELLMSIQQGGPINKKTALDRAIGNDNVNGNTLSRVSREFTRTLTNTKRVLPEIRQTRFRNTADFYSLFMILWQMQQDKLVLADKRRNAIAFRLLRRLSDGVDELRNQLRRAKPAKQSQQFYARYLLTVQGDTDSASNRQRRAEILRGLLGSLFEYKDEKRTFSPEQRRLLWNSEEKHTCTKCHRQLTWTDFTIDHVKAWIKGGRTALSNAKLMCRRCNSGKGAT